MAPVFAIVARRCAKAVWSCRWQKQVTSRGQAAAAAEQPDAASQGVETPLIHSVVLTVKKGKCKLEEFGFGLVPSEA